VIEVELFLGGLAAFVVEVLVFALLLAPRWTLRQLARPLRALGGRLRALPGALRTRLAGQQRTAASTRS
jgi:hypothetical protein